MSNRKQLLSSIAQRSRRLDDHRAKMQHIRTDLRRYIQGANPLFLLAGGLVAGAALHQIGWRNAYGIVMFSYRHFSDQALS